MPMCMHCTIVVLLCRKPVLPIEQELLLAHKDKKVMSGSENDIEVYCKKMKKFKKSMFVEVNANIKSAQAKYKKDYDMKHCSKKVCIVA